MIEDMPRPKPPGLIHDRNRHGTWRWVYRAHKSAPRIALTADYGTPEFWQQYRDAAAGIAPGQKQRPGQGRKGTLQWLVDRWRESSDWKATAPATQRQRDNILFHVMATSSDVQYRDITRQHIVEGRERRQETPFAANNFLKTMRALFAWAKDAGLVEVNPAADVKFLAKRTGGFEPWNHADIEAYRAHWPLGTRARVALEALYATGLRRGDVVKLSRTHIKDGIFEIRTEKTGEVVYPRMTAAFQEAIEAGPVGSLLYVVGADLMPMVKESFGNSFGDWCRKAGIRKSAHGLRKLVVTEAVEAGCTEAELQDMFGWTTIKQSSIYTRSRMRKRSAATGWSKRAGNGGDTNPPGGMHQPFQKGLKSRGE